MAADACDTNLDAAGFADFADGVLGIANEIEEDLNELIGIADHHGQGRERLEVDFDIVAAEGVLVQLKGAIDEAVDVEGFFLG